MKAKEKKLRFLNPKRMIDENKEINENVERGNQYYIGSAGCFWL